MYLNCHTRFSLRYGSISEEELLRLALEQGISCLAVTDINSSSACISFARLAEKSAVKSLAGIDFRNGMRQQFVGLAKNNRGFAHLNRFLSAHLHKDLNFAEKAPALEACFFVYPFSRFFDELPNDLSEDEFIGVNFSELNKLKFWPGLKQFQHKLVLLQPLSFRNKRDYNAHRLLRAIDNNCLLSKLPKSEQAGEEEFFMPPQQLQEGLEEFSFLPENTRVLMEACEPVFDFSKKQNQNLSVYLSSKAEDQAYLERLCREKLPLRYPDAGQEVEQRLQKELKAIIDLGFVSYFLINYDIIQFARRRNFSFVGRGSGANSVVAYILGITNVDPIELNLYFERFINASRKSPPDFDIDFSWKDREEVTAYIFNRFEHTALMGTYVTFKRRALVRELGKVFGLPTAEIDKLSAGFFNYKELDELEKLVLRYSKLIEDFPNYLSVHSGGILILDRPVYHFCGSFMPPKGFETVQIDMHLSETIGIHKFDILAQRGLSKITDAIELVKENQPEAVLEDIENISVFKNDAKINALLAKGDCMGVFYVESPAMRGLLLKLQTDNYLNLVAASSVIRPGVSSGGMKEEFILRHRDPERRKQAHPVMYEIMPDTYGVMVYQEDVIKVAHEFAGLGFDDADVLRRGMSGKKVEPGAMERIEETFMQNCKERIYSRELSEEVWHQITSFAGYAFPKGHSASYAVESYQSLYLKCYFPLEFMVAAINNGGGFYDLETYVQEIRRLGGRVHAPEINKSDHANVIYGKDVYLGLGYIKELELKSIQKILENRQFFGKFQDLNDFLDRVSISIEQLALLLKINAFRFTGIDKHQLLWKAYFRLNGEKNKSRQEQLFRIQSRDFKLPEFEFSRLVEAYDQMELLGFPLCSHFELLRDPLQEDTLLSSQLEDFVGKQVKIYGSLITVKPTKTINNELMYFGTFYDKEGGIFDTVQFPAVAARYPLRVKGVYLCYGKVVDDLGYISIDVQWLSRQATATDPRLERE